MRCLPISVSRDNWHTRYQMTRLTLLFNIQLLHWNCYLFSLVLYVEGWWDCLRWLSVVWFATGNHNGHQYLYPKGRKWTHVIKTKKIELLTLDCLMKWTYTAVDNLTQFDASWRQWDLSCEANLNPLMIRKTWGYFHANLLENQNAKGQCCHQVEEIICSSNCHNTTMKKESFT